MLSPTGKRKGDVQSSRQVPWNGYRQGPIKTDQAKQEGCLLHVIHVYVSVHTGLVWDPDTVSEGPGSHSTCSLVGDLTMEDDF